jgi:hypothetical protein
MLVNAVVRQADATMSLLFAACTSASLASKQSAAPQAREATIKKPTGEHEMLQPVGQGINTQGILADGTNWLLYRLGQGLRKPKISRMACENV